jgi:hypothetical protein
MLSKRRLVDSHMENTNGVQKDLSSFGDIRRCSPVDICKIVMKELQKVVEWQIEDGGG